MGCSVQGQDLDSVILVQATSSLLEQSWTSASCAGDLEKHERVSWIKCAIVSLRGFSNVSMTDRLQWKRLAGKEPLGETKVCDWRKRKVPFVSRAEK